MRNLSNSKKSIYGIIKSFYFDHLILANVMFGGVLGYLFLHPIVMVITQYMHFHSEGGFIHFHNILKIYTWIITGYESVMLPWILSFTIVGMVVGLYYGTLLKKQKTAVDALRKSEERYKRLFDSTLDGVYRTDAKGVFTMINQAGAEILGHKTPEEVINRPAQDYWVNLKDREFFRKELKRKKSLNAYPILARKADGKKIVLENTARVLESNGNFRGIEGILRDINERKKAEEALRKRTHDLGERVKELKGLYGTSQLIADPDNTLDDVFKGAVDLIPPSWQYPEITCARITFEDKQFKTPNWKKSKWIQSTDIATKKEKGGVIEVAYLEQKPEIDEGPFLKEERNLIDGLARILGDFIERKQAEEAVKKYTSEIEEANRLKDLFTDIMRHDILNPAGIIKNIAEFGLQEKPGDEESELVLESALRIQDIIETASKLSKMDSLKELEKEEVDLKEIIDKESEHCSSLIQKAGMELENKISVGLPIRANPMIREVFLNLFTNATKYAPEGKKVIVEAEDIGENYKITVKDFGEGIPDELKERIFDRFKRREKAGVKGTGLGLAIVKRLVELHNGKVWVEDNPEGGSIFVVEIPKTGWKEGD